MINLIPYPNDIKIDEGYFVLNSKTIIVFNDFLESKELATTLKHNLKNITGYDFKIMPLMKTDPNPNQIIVNLGNFHKEAETYLLEVKQQQIVLTSSTQQGLFYGIQTLSQLIKLEKSNWVIGNVTIKDKPRFKYRGMHLDVSRTFYGVEFVKKYIDLLAMYKFNIFHWHLTDDQGWRIEIKKYPKLTKIGAWRETTTIGHALNKEPKIDNKMHGGFYTQEQIKEVVAYAKSRFITIIPEIDVPGHASAILAAYPELSCNKNSHKVESSFGIFKAVLCPSTQSLIFIKDVLTEVAALFPSPYIHIGGDEVKTTEWQNCDYCSTLAKKNGYKDATYLQTYFTKKIVKFAKELNKKIIGWDEVLSFTQDTDVAIMSWRSVQSAVDAATANHKVIMTPLKAYFDFYQSRSLDEPQAIHGVNTLKEVYNYNWIPKDIKPQQRKNILGIQANVWTEYVRTEEQVEYMILPRMLAIAEAAWTSMPNRDWKRFSSTINDQLVGLTKKGYHSSVSANKVFTQAQLDANNNLKVELSTQLNGLEIYYSIDGSKPSLNSLLYTTPIILHQSATIKAFAYDPQSQQIFGDTQLHFSHHLALGKPVVIVGKEMSHKQTKVLTNGQLLRQQIFHYDEWFGFNDKQLDFVIDLEKTTKVNTITVGFKSKLHRRLYAPTALTVYVSTDNKTWQKAAYLNSKQLDTDKLEIEIEIMPQQLQYIKLTIENNQKYYSSEDEKEKPVTLYIDEIEIN